MKEEKDNRVEMIDFEVEIPGLEGEGIAEVHTIKVPARKSASGEWILTSEALDKIEDTQARYMGLMTPSEIKALRMRIQCSQREMSHLIQAGEKSYTRWENGKARLSRLVNIVLCSIRDGFLPVSYLQTLYQEGSDWYKKVQAYEEHSKSPNIYKISAHTAGVEMTRPAASTSDCPSNFWGAASKSRWIPVNQEMACYAP